MNNLQSSLITLQKNLNILREREAKHAGNAPPELLNQIEDHERAIELTEAVRRGELSETEWREALEPLLVSIDSRSGRSEISRVELGDVAGGIIGSIIAGRDVIGNVINVYYQESVTAPTAEERLAAALALLEQMPTAEVPEVGVLPRGSRMPFNPNPLFVGRESNLMALAKALKVGGTAAIGQTVRPAHGAVAAATGLGGIGKTQLASEFVHRYGPYFAGGVFWLSLAEAGTVAAEVAACGGRECLNLAADYESLDLPAQVALVRAAWHEGTPRLLVFDNCEDEALLAEWRPRTGGCRVVITSRRGKWDPALGVKELPLGVLARRQSIELLQKLIEARTGEARSEEARRRGGGTGGNCGGVGRFAAGAASGRELFGGVSQGGDCGGILSGVAERGGAGARVAGRGGFEGIADEPRTAHGADVCLEL